MAATIKLPREIRDAIKEKIRILRQMTIIDASEEDAVERSFERAIETQPDRDPYVVLDQMTHTYFDKFFG